MLFTAVVTNEGNKNFSIGYSNNDQILFTVTVTGGKSVSVGVSEALKKKTPEIVLEVACEKILHDVTTIIMDLFFDEEFKVNENRLFERSVDHSIFDVLKPL